MNKSSLIVLFTFIYLGITACNKDNNDPPNANIVGEYRPTSSSVTQKSNLNGIPLTVDIDVEYTDESTISFKADNTYESNLSYTMEVTSTGIPTTLTGQRSAKGTYQIDGNKIITDPDLFVDHQGIDYDESTSTFSLTNPSLTINQDAKIISATQIPGGETSIDISAEHILVKK